jgi:oxygen-independent coproporphyrinogen-3 oxidase
VSADRAPVPGGVVSTAELVARYDKPGPRYTSYPTAVEFHAGFTEADYRQRLAAADALGSEPLSMYAHLPFCEERCLFCGCNVVITKRRDVPAQYLDQVLGEVDLLAKALPHRRRVSQMHWGGGTPTFYPPHDLERLFHAIAERFEFTPDAELGIEVDPRVTTPRQIEALRKLGFNRLSMGVQDFAPEVQRAVHRIQSYEWTRAMVEQARAEGFGSINIDLIYGLPYQTVEGFRQTLERVIEIRPDRVAVYSFAFVPWIKAHMKHLPQESMPDAALKLELLALSIDAFTRGGYRAIGMDHFALPTDELSRAIESRTLSRNFMGYTVQSARDMVGVGISAIGDVQGAFVQNVKKLPDYEQSIAAGRFPIERGYRLDADDTVRRHVITELMCNFHLDRRDVERRFDISFASYFAPELAELTGAPAADGLIEVTPETLDVTPLGRRFVRNLCMVFDRHLRARAAEEKPVFSRTV